MGLRFITGRAGSGKTACCIREIMEKQGKPNTKQIYIVPEQFTSQAERDLMEKTGNTCLLTAEVLSFGRLAHRVFSKQGIGDRIPLGDIGKSMALQKILLEEKEELSYFKNIAEKAGFIDQLAMTVTEFSRNCVLPEEAELLSSQEGLTDAAKDKLKDFARIYRSYLDFLKRDYISGDETLTLLAERLDETAGFRHTEFWIDGFYGFTPQEYEVIRRLLLCAEQVTITLPMSKNSFTAGFLPPSAPFYEPYRIKKRLTALAEEIGTAVLPPVFLTENHRTQSPALRALEENYFYANFRKCSLHEGITLTVCPSLADEIRFAAGKILRLVREEHCRYKDIAIVTNAMSVYEKNLRGILEEYNIPCFIDSRRETLSHPLMTLLTSLLDILVYDFRYEAVFSYLKTGLAPLTMEETDILENYVLAYGIKGWKWKKEPWTWGIKREGAEAVEAIDALRERVMEPLRPLLPFTEKKEFPFKEFIHALTAHLEALHAAETLDGWAEDAAENGNTDKAEEYRQIWQLVLDLFEKASSILGEEKITLSAAAGILTAGLKKCTMGVIPPSSDCLVVGDIERSRLPDLKYLFVLGVNEGILPSPSTPQGIFTEAERSLLTEKGLEMAGDTRRKLYEEQFLIYQGLSRPREHLWLTYAASDAEGRALFPSSLIDRLCRMDEALVVEKQQEFCLEESCPADAFHLLGRKMREHSEETPISPLWAELYRFFDSRPEWKSRLTLLKSGLKNDRPPERLAPQTVRSLYGKNILSSVSRLERFAGCPFSFFAEFGLKAEERRLYQLHTPDLGLVFHRVLENFSCHLEENSIRWQDLTQKETEDYIDSAVDEAVPILEENILQDTAANRYLIKRLKRISKRAAWTLVCHVQSGDFVPAGYEVGFGLHEALPPIVLSLSSGGKLILNGKIDRVDLLDAEGNRYVKIIDYKSGNKVFSFQDIFYGLQLQLLIYLDAYLKYYEENNQALQPGGVFYFRIKEPSLNLEKEMSAEEIEQALYDSMKMSGLLLQEPSLILGLDHAMAGKDGTLAGESSIIPLKYTKKGALSSTSNVATKEQYEVLLDFVCRRAAALGDSMQEGIITPAPYRKGTQSPCEYCSYRSICRHDYGEKAHWRDLKKMDKKDFWNTLIPPKEGE